MAFIQMASTEQFGDQQPWGKVEHGDSSKTGFLPFLWFPEDLVNPAVLAAASPGKKRQLEKVFAPCLVGNHP